MFREIYQRLPMNALLPDPVPIAALNQYSYCPHRCWRMFCAGEFVDNQYTIEGTSLHERVHTLSAGNQGETYQVRAIWLKSDRYGLIGKSDLIEEVDGQWYPVEYKRGQRGEHDNDELQVCAQALCGGNDWSIDLPGLHLLCSLPSAGVGRDQRSFAPANYRDDRVGD
jgi:CRISPR-associated protein Cas4